MDRDDRKVRSVLSEYRIARDFRVKVGPPDAMISITVVDPVPSMRLAFESDDKSLRLMGPATRPSTSKARKTPEPLRGTVFLLHGIGNARYQSPYQLWATVLNLANYRCVLVDLRGHGDSTGRNLTYGVVEQHDLLQVLDDLEERGLIVGPVGVLGASYGGAIAIQWASIDPRVKAVVSLEPFSSFHSAVYDVAPLVLGRMQFLFPPRRIESVIRQAGQLGGFDPKDACSVCAMRRCSQPVLLIHGANDVVLSPDNSRRIHAAAPETSKLIIVPGVGHEDLWYREFKTTRTHTIKWFDQHLKTRPTSQPVAPAG